MDSQHNKDHIQAFQAIPYRSIPLPPTLKGLNHPKKLGATRSYNLNSTNFLQTIHRRAIIRRKFQHLFVIILRLFGIVNMQV